MTDFSKKRTIPPQPEAAHALAEEMGPFVLLMDADLAKLRRFALAIGLVLFLYSIAGVQLPKPATVNPLGISLEITRPEIFEWGLVVASVYAALRYWYYGCVKNLSPFKARRLLYAGQYKASDASEVLPVARRYLPGMEDQVSIVRNTPPDLRIGASGAGRLQGSARLWVRLDTFDFTAPIWANVIAIVAFLFSRF